MAADIHALEIEFAKNPTLEACIPLCEAYLAQKRFMEAMVVCKKGIKSAPTDARGRVMLARVYVEQGKLPKAQQELEQFLAEVPGHPMALEILGKLLIDQGRQPEGVAMLQQAVNADPNRNLARQWLMQMGVAAPQAAAPAPQMAPPPQMAPQAAPPPMAAPPPRPQAAPQQFQQAPQQFQQQPQAFAPQQFQQQPQQFQQQPQAFAPQGMQPPPPAFGGHQAAAAAHAPAPAHAVEEHGRPLEHVNDFFAPDTLGFSNDNSGIETAGPGRLTILGFVPKSTGSIKTTLFVALGVIAVAGAVIAWQWKKGDETRKINKLYGDLKTAMDEDKAVRYHDALKIADKVFEIDDGHNLTLGAAAYANAVLAVDFREETLAKAKDHMKKAQESSDDDTEYRVAAQALISYADGQYDQGLAKVHDFQDVKKGSAPLLELEALRLMQAAKPAGDKSVSMQLARVVQTVTSQARIYSFLGWYYYNNDEFALADKNFAQALQNVRGHPKSLLGQALTDLDRGMGLQERQKEIEKSIKGVLSMPPEDLDQTTMALGFFARAQLELWQNNGAAAEEDYKQAFKLDPDNALLYYKRGSMMLSLGQSTGAIDFLKKASGKAPNNVKYYKTLVDAQVKARDFAGAKATLDRAMQLSTNDVELKILDGDRLRSQKQFADAIAAYKKVTREDGGTPYTIAMLGISAALRDSGKKPEAVKHMTDFLANAPASVDPMTSARMWCELGVDHAAAGNSAAALEAFQSGIDAFRYYPDCHFFVCRTIGKGEEATEACKAYLALAPRGEWADQARARTGGK